MSSDSESSRLIPVAFVLCSLLVLWMAGYKVLWSRLTTGVVGEIVDARDIPSAVAPGYVTEYTYRGKDGDIHEYIATAFPGSLERSIPVHTEIRKEKWELGYWKGKERVGFPTLPYVVAVVVGVFGLFYGIFSLLPERTRYRE